METPSQTICGLGGFIIALFLSAVLGDLILKPLSILLQGHPDVEDVVGPVCIGIFLVLWWVAALGLRRWQVRRIRSHRPGRGQ